MNKEISVYKIHRPSDGKYARSGNDTIDLHWSKTGKVWTSIAHVKSHLRAIVWQYLNTKNSPYCDTEETKIAKYKAEGFVYKDCVLQKLSSETGLTETPISDILDEMQLKREEGSVGAKLREIYGPDFI